jgi:hypothetical protein
VKATFPRVALPVVLGIALACRNPGPASAPVEGDSSQDARIVGFATERWPSVAVHLAQGGRLSIRLDRPHGFGLLERIAAALRLGKEVRLRTARAEIVDVSLPAPPEIPIAARRGFIFTDVVGYFGADSTRMNVIFRRSARGDNAVSVSRPDFPQTAVALARSWRDRTELQHAFGESGEIVLVPAGAVSSPPFPPLPRLPSR